MEQSMKYCKEFDGRAMEAMGHDRFETRSHLPRIIRFWQLPFPRKG
jgi:hypothetical protein